MKNIIKLITLVSILLLMQSCRFNSKEGEEFNSLEKNKTEFNAEEEFSNINTHIEKKNTDSVSTDNYTYWLKNGKIIKLNIFEGDGENYVIKEDYYFKDDNVFAYQKENIDFSNAMKYKALIFYNDSKIIKEDYWIGDEKKTKESIENQLKRNGLTIHNEIILDKETNKSKGLLTLLDLSKRFNFNYKTAQKSSETKEQNLNNLNEVFQGQELKTGERIVKINWGMENKTNYSRDMSYSGSRFASTANVVPNRKKWILLYINEDFTFESGNIVGSVPDLFIDNNEEKINNRRFSNPNNINLSRAKDENIKCYSGSAIKAISSRTKGNGPGDNFIEYKGEMWFLEIND